MSEQRVVIGVDAGGSRTAAVAADARGAELARGEAGAGAVRPGHADASAAAIAAACRTALQRSRVAAPVDALVAGASGAGREAERLALEQALEAEGLARKVHVTTDAEIALEAAFGPSGSGVVLIAGTGSVAWARLPAGATARSGGFGPVVGDWGSSHEIASLALRAVRRALLGEAQARDLLRRLAVHLGVPAGDVPRWALAASVPEIAGLAPVVLEAARDGNAAAREIVYGEACNLVRMVAPLFERFGNDQDVALAWGGGLLREAADYRRMVLGMIREQWPRAQVGEHPVDAVLGAVALALRV